MNPPLPVSFIILVFPMTDFAWFHPLSSDGDRLAPTLTFSQ